MTSHNVSLSSLHTGVSLGQFTCSPSPDTPHHVVYIAETSFVLYDTQTKVLLASYSSSPPTHFTVIVWKDDGIYTGDVNGTVLKWALKMSMYSSEEIGTLHMKCFHLSVSKNKQYSIVSAMALDGTIIVYKCPLEETSWNIVQEMKGQMGILSTTCDGQWMVRGDLLGEMTLFQWKPCNDNDGLYHWKMEYKWKRHKTSIASLSWSFYEKKEDHFIWRLCSGDQNGTIMIWSIDDMEITSGVLEMKIDERFTLRKEHVLKEHSDAVTSVFKTTFATLVSVSMDGTICIWSLLNNKWKVNKRLGKWGTSGTGFTWGVSLGRGILALGHEQHQLYQWKMKENSSLVEKENELSSLSNEVSSKVPIISDWEEVTTVSGHFDGVTGLIWNAKYHFLLSCGLDATIRMWVQSKEDRHWHEIARPIIHGHRMTSLCVLPVASHPTIATSSTEDIIRIYTAPTCILNSLENISLQKTPTVFKNETNIPSAMMPELNLSTIPASEKDTKNNLYAGGLPLGAALERHTSWLERQKCHGHLCDVLTVSASVCGNWMASGCNTNSEDFASVLLWRLEKSDSDGIRYAVHQKLRGPTKSVMKLAFSPNGHWLVAVSRDRHIVWYALQQNTTMGDDDTGEDEDEVQSSKWVQMQRSSGHKRMILTCTWSCDSQYVATGSRDSTIKVWKLQGAEWKEIYGCSVEDAVTSLLFAECPKVGRVLFVGMGNGLVRGFIVATDASIEISQDHAHQELSLKEIIRIERDIGHVKAVSDMVWHDGELTTCSMDHSIRRFNCLLETE